MPKFPGTVNGNYMTGGIAGRLYNSSVSNIKAEININLLL